MLNRDDVRCELEDVECSTHLFQTHYYFYYYISMTKIRAIDTCEVIGRSFGKTHQRFHFALVFALD